MKTFVFYVKDPNGTGHFSKIFIDHDNADLAKEVLERLYPGFLILDPEQFKNSTIKF